MTQCTKIPKSQAHTFKIKSVFVAPHDALNASEGVFLKLLRQIVGDHLLPLGIVGLVDEALVQPTAAIIFSLYSLMFWPMNTRFWARSPI